MSIRDIAASQGVPKSTVHQALQRVEHSPDYLDFVNHKDGVFEELQYRLLQEADGTALKTMLNKRGLTDVAILQDKIQAMRGQATQIIDVRGAILQLDGRLEQLSAVIHRQETDDN